MENEAHVKKLHTSLLRSKWAIFSIVAFLALFTYLLITISGQVSTQESQINTAPRANTSGIDAKMPISCDNYWMYFQINLEYLKTKLACNSPLPTPTGPYALEPQGVQGPPFDSVCQALTDLENQANEMKEFISLMCNRCPMPTPTPPSGGSGGYPTPTTWPLYPTITGKLYPTPTPAQWPRPTSSGPIIPIDPQPTYSPQ